MTCHGKLSHVNSPFAAIGKGDRITVKPTAHPTIAGMDGTVLSVHGRVACVQLDCEISGATRTIPVCELALETSSDYVGGTLDGAHVLHAAGYESLADVLRRAFDQAASGKGKERHAAAGEPFDKQVMQQGAQRFGVGALLFQAFKKCEESQRLRHDAAIRELLGAIVYTAGAVIALEAAHLAAESGAAHA